MTVRAGFTFRNNGGAPATGVRVRFNLPEGLVYRAGSGRLDDADLDDELGNSPLLSCSGAHVGDVAPGEERRLEVAYGVVGAIENAATVELQAAVASSEVQPVGSNVVRLVARSRPALANALTGVTIETRCDPAPGAEAEITVRIHNAGESSAHDVAVVAPIPEHTAYVPGSARVNGREIERDLGTRFDRVYAPIVAATLSASNSAMLVYRVRIASPLPDGTRICANAQVASQETAAFALEPAVLVVHAAPDFADDRTTFTIEPATHVRPGERVVAIFSLQNTGTAAAENAWLTLELPESLLYVRGAARIDGRPARERSGERLIFDLGRIEGGERLELGCEAVAAAPLPDGATLSIAATLAWQPFAGEKSRRFERSIVVRSEPALIRRRNTIVRTGERVVRPGQEVEAAIALANGGSAAVQGATLCVRLDPALEDVCLIERGVRIPLEAGGVDLGTIEPHAERRVLLQARVRTPCADRSEIVVAASLTTRELGETQLGEAGWRVDSHAAFSPASSRLELASGAVLRPNQLADVLVNVTNVGSDVARNVRIGLLVSPEARFESVEGATRERSSVVFAEIAPGETAHARLTLCLLRSVRKEHPLTVDAVLTADAMLPVPLERLTIVTTATPDFSVGNFCSNSSDAVDPGETIEWALHARNGGDGSARQVQIRVAQPASLIYVPNSTTVNDVPIRDVGAVGPFASERGIVLNEFDPGVEATIRWRDVVHNQLPAGDSIVRVAHITYDGDRFDEIASGELKVRAAPVFANAVPGLQFGLEGLVGPASGGPRDERCELTPATAESGAQHGAPEQHEGTYVNGHAAETVDGLAGTVVGFHAEWLGRVLRFLEEARFSGLVTHLFALRAFMPEALGEGHTSLGAAAQGLRDELDRLFIKLRLPSYSIAPRDIETPSTRAVIERLVHEAGAARGVPAEPAGASIVLRGSIDPGAMREIGERLHRAPQASAAPWAALARFMPDATPQALHYRTLLIDRLDTLAAVDAEAFVDALQHRADSVLDGALDVFLASLRATVP